MDMHSSTFHPAQSPWAFDGMCYSLYGSLSDPQKRLMGSNAQLYRTMGCSKVDILAYDHHIHAAPHEVHEHKKSKPYVQNIPTPPL